MGISVQTLWVLVFRGVNDLPEGSFRRNDPSLTNRIPNGSNGSTKTAACSGWEEPLRKRSGFWFLRYRVRWSAPRCFHLSTATRSGSPRCLSAQCRSSVRLTQNRPAFSCSSARHSVFGTPTPCPTLRMPLATCTAALLANDLVEGPSQP